MPQCCAVPKCSNKKGGHKFPKDTIRLKQWIAAIRRDFSPTKNSIVCKDHFSKDDYELPKDSVYANPRLQLKKTAVPSRFPWSKETNGFLQKRREPTGHRHSINKNSKEETKVPFEHKHVLKQLHDKQFFCDICHKRFTRISPQGLHNKHSNVKTEATPAPGASDSTVPFIKQEKEVEYEVENKEDSENEISTKSEDKFTSNETEGPSAVANNNLSYYLTIPPTVVQKQEIKVECIEVEIQTKDYENESTEPVENILDETSTEQIEHRNVSKKSRTRDKPYSCVCGQKFTSTTRLNNHKARYNHYKDNPSDIKKEDGRTEVTSAVASDANDSLVLPAFVKHEIKEEYTVNEIPKEKTTEPFEHKHVLKQLDDKQFFCDVCHKRFTRISPQGLHNKHTNVKTEATPVPGASDSTVPFIKQEKEVEYVEVEIEENNWENITDAE